MDLILYWVLYKMSLRNQIFTLWETIIKKTDKADKGFRTYLDVQAGVPSLGTIAYCKHRLEWPRAVLWWWALADGALLEPSLIH